MLPKLAQEETIWIHLYIDLKLTQQIKNLPKQKVPGPDVFTDEFHQMLKEEMIPVFYDIFQRIEAKGIFYNLFYEAQHYPDYKARQRHYKKGKLKTYIYHDHRCKNSQQNANKLNPAMCKKDYTP